MALELSRDAVQNAVNNVKDTVGQMENCIGEIDSFLNGTMYGLWNTPAAHDDFAAPLQRAISDFVGQFNTIFNGNVNAFIESCNDNVFIPEKIDPIQERCDQNLSDITLGWQGQESNFNVDPSFSAGFESCKSSINSFSTHIDSVKSFLNDAYSTGLAASFSGAALQGFNTTAESAKDVLAKYNTKFYEDALTNDKNTKARMSA